MEFPALISNAGHLSGKDRLKLDDTIRGLAGKRVRISVKVYQKPRSLKQSKFYQGPFIAAIQKYLLDCGQRVSHDDIHAGLRDAYAKNGYTLLLPGDKPFRIPPSTARLSTADFENFLEEIRAEFAQKFGWQLPFPNEDDPGWLPDNRGG